MVASSSIPLSEFSTMNSAATTVSGNGFTEPSVRPPNRVRGPAAGRVARALRLGEIDQDAARDALAVATEFHPVLVGVVNLGGFGPDLEPVEPTLDADDGERERAEGGAGQHHREREPPAAHQQ